MGKKYAKSFQLYKPRKDNSGTASSWNLNVDKDSVFLEFSHQKPDNSGEFNWDKKCIMKLGIADIGEIIAVLNKNQGGVGQKDNSGKRKGLYHKNQKGNTILTFTYISDNGIFGIRLSQKIGDGPVQKFQHMITIGEAEILKIFLSRCVERLYEDPEN